MVEFIALLVIDFTCASEFNVTLAPFMITSMSSKLPSAALLIVTVQLSP